MFSTKTRSPSAAMRRAPLNGPKPWIPHSLRPETSQAANPTPASGHGAPT
ncbi:MAG: hypothetical protein BWZ02_03319 [Lentisphaerae bacterium ADurb.BinA184]|nr:MAG: hypothetical protein BWZ02_03319 [Lentisphaerae bacterium ADurb.BinA184]